MALVFACGLLLCLCAAQAQDKPAAMAFEPAGARSELFLEQRRAFLEQLKASSGAALASAQRAVQQAQSMRRADPRRVDAMDLLCLAYLDTGAFDKAASLAAEVVRLRGAAQPPEPQLLALSLNTQAAALFLLQRHALADAAFAASQQAWRQALESNDLRLAPWLEAQASDIRRGQGRTRWAIELLQEAARLRALHPESSRGRLAQTLEELGIHEMHLARYGDAEAHFVEAIRWLESEALVDPAREELPAAIAQLQMMRAGIAGALGDKARVLELARGAAAIELKDQRLRAETQVLLRASLAAVLQGMGDVAGAIVAEREALSVFERHQDLLESGRLDKELLGTTLVGMGNLYLQHGEPVPARQALRAARMTLGDVPEVLFALAELERLGGDEPLSISLYEKALNARGLAVDEVGVLLAGGRVAVLVPKGPRDEAPPVLPLHIVPLPAGVLPPEAPMLFRAQRGLDEAQWTAQVRSLMGKSKRHARSALVWVPGFQVSRDEAARQAAQMASDIEFDGVVFVHSWASAASGRRPSDETEAAALADLVRLINHAGGFQTIHVIAHGMAAQVLLPALKRVSNGAAVSGVGALGEVVLLAPTLSEEDFRQGLEALPAAGAKPGRITLYAQAPDASLWSAWQAGGVTALAGMASPDLPLMHPRVQTIEVRRASQPPMLQLNRDQWLRDPLIVQDIRALLQSGPVRSPQQRNPLVRPVPAAGGLPLSWTLEPAAAASR